MKKNINIILALALVLSFIPLNTPANAANVANCMRIGAVDQLSVLTSKDVQIAADDVTVSGMSYKGILTDIIKNKVKEWSGKSPDVIVGSSCPVLDPVYKKFQADFITFLDTTFKNKSSTTSLSNVAIAEFYNYKMRLRESCGLFNYYITEKPLPSTKCDTDPKKADDLCYFTNMAEVDAKGKLTGQTVLIYKNGFNRYLKSGDRIDNNYSIVQDCGNLLTAYEGTAADIMKNHMKTNVVQKRATIMIQKLKAINNQMRDLTMKIGQVYSYIRTFCGKLPFKTNAPVMGGG